MLVRVFLVILPFVILSGCVCERKVNRAYLSGLKENMGEQLSMGKLDNERLCQDVGSIDERISRMEKDVKAIKAILQRGGERR